MKTLFAAVSAIGLLASTPAFAQSTATGEILLAATVAPACGTGNHKSGAASAAGWDQADITVNLADGNGQFAGQSFANRSFGNVWCNNGATVTLSVGALTSSSTSGDTGSFTNRFDVSVVTDAGVYVGAGQDAVLSTAGETGGVKSLTGPTGGAFETGLQRFGGADSISVLADPSNRRAVAGSYAGFVRFTATTN